MVPIFLVHSSCWATEGSGFSEGDRYCCEGVGRGGYSNLTFSGRLGFLYLPSWKKINVKCVVNFSRGARLMLSFSVPKAFLTVGKRNVLLSLVFSNIPRKEQCFGNESRTRSVL